MVCRNGILFPQLIMPENLLFVANVRGIALHGSLEVSWMTGKPGNYVSVVSRIYVKIVETKGKLYSVCYMNLPCWHRKGIIILHYYVSSAAVKVIRSKLLVYSTHCALDQNQTNCFPFLLITQTGIIILVSDTHVTNRQKRILQRFLSLSKWSSVLVYDSLWKLSFSDYKKDENYSHADISAWSASSIFTAPRYKRKILVAPYVELRVVVYLNRSHLTKSVFRSQ